MLAESLAEAWAEASLLEASLRDRIDAEALAETVLKLLMALACKDSEAEFSTDRVLRLASDCKISLFWLAVELANSLRLTRELEYSESDRAETELAESLS